MKFVYKLYFILLYLPVRLIYAVRAIHPERMPHGPVLLCANHSAYSDPLLISFSLGIKVWPRFMAKKELKRVPVLGCLLKMAGVIFVDRGKSDVAAIKSAMRILKDGGTVMIFPEGTRVKDDGSADVKTGAVMLAARTGAPIVPVYIPRKKRLLSRIPVVFGEPFSIPRDVGDYSVGADELMARIDMLKGET